MLQGRINGVRKAVCRVAAGALMASCLAAAPFSALADTVLANGHVYLRKGASTVSDILLVLQPNAEMEVIGTQGEWYQVRYGAKEGYVRSDVVTLKGGTTFTGVMTGYNTSVTSYRTLREGSSGEDVLTLESRLATLGFFDGVPDQKYDDQTAYAVRLFQEENGLSADGVAGEKTQELLLGVIGTSAATAGTTSAYRSLDLNDTGSDVLAVQRKLQELGYYDGELTGTYGNLTKEAVRQYQKQNGLGADGIAGEKTQTKLLGEAGSTTSTTTVTTTLREGSSGNDVLTLQQKLKDLGYYTGELTGSYGSLTKEAVRLYQRANDLGSDGIAGPKTLSKLNATPSTGTGSTTGTTTGGTTSSGVTDESNKVTNQVLRYGDRGDVVRNLQQRLKDLGYLAGSADGVFGQATDAALRSFQTSNGLAADGIAGSKTQTVLYSSSAKSYSSATDSSTLKQGSQGTLVKNMQQRLKDLGYYDGTVTGNFGPLTEEAVKRFQSAQGLTVDGIAGVNTLNKLYAMATGSGSTSSGSSGTTSSGGTVISGMATTMPNPASVQNVNWYTYIRPKYDAGTVMQIYDFSTGYTWQCVMMSNGAHSDSQPRTADDTAVMYKAFGNKNTWTPKAVWVTFPDGKTYIASMHNVPHLSGSIKDNNFDGHLCIHFPREMDEAEETGPYAVSHQQAIIKGWEQTQAMIK